jgi:hypothetical protein
MEQINTPTYTGTSSSGDISEALAAAVVRAKEAMLTDIVKWKLVSLEGVNGGFVETNLVSVTISATLPG